MRFQILANNEKPMMEVESRYFAGAMVLLQESGEMEQVKSHQNERTFLGGRALGGGVGDAMAECQSRV